MTNFLKRHKFLIGIIILIIIGLAIVIPISVSNENKTDSFANTKLPNPLAASPGHRRKPCYLDCHGLQKKPCCALCYDCYCGKGQGHGTCKGEIAKDCCSNGKCEGYYKGACGCCETEKPHEGPDPLSPATPSPGLAPGDPVYIVSAPLNTPAQQTAINTGAAAPEGYDFSPDKTGSPPALAGSWSLQPAAWVNWKWDPVYVPPPLPAPVPAPEYLIEAWASGVYV